MEKLKPCPFCGSKRVYVATSILSAGCHDCGMEVRTDKVLSNEIIKAWNTKSDVSIGISRMEKVKKINLLAEMLGGNYATFGQQLEIAKRFIDSTESKNVIGVYDTSKKEDQEAYYTLCDSPDAENMDFIITVQKKQS